MKKLLVILSIFFSILIFNNVKAEDYDTSIIEPIDVNSLNNIKVINTFTLSDEEVYELFKIAYSQLTNDKINEYYNKYISFRNFGRENTEYGKYYFTQSTSIGPSYIYTNLIGFQNVLLEGYKNVDSVAPLGYYVGYKLTFNFSNQTYMYKYSNNEIILNIKYASRDWFSAGSNIFLDINKMGYIQYVFIDTEINKEITYSSNSAFNLNWENNTYSPGNVLPFTTESGINYNLNKEVNISFDNINNEIENGEIISTSVDINIENFDSNKHILQQSNSNLWNESLNDYEFSNILNIENLTYKTYTNGDLIVRIIDKDKYLNENTIDIIKSATLTIDNIIEKKPDIIFNIIRPNACEFVYNDIKTYTCMKLIVNIKNYDLQRYQAFYSYNSIEWEPIYNKNFEKIFTENTDYYIKILDKMTNTYLNSRSISINNINSEIIDLGQQIKFETEYSKGIFKLNTLFYNYDRDNYNYYMKINDEEFIDIKDNIAYLSNILGIYKKEFYSNTVVIFEIRDLNNNYITSASINIDNFDYENSSNLKDIFNFLDSDKFKDNINNIYEKFRNSKIGIYIFIIISGSILILLIKSMNK